MVLVASSDYEQLPRALQPVAPVRQGQLDGQELTFDCCVGPFGGAETAGKGGTEMQAVVFR